MDASARRASARGFGRLLLHPPFVSVGGSLLIAAFASDLMYYQTSLIAWANSSAWLITAGLVLALIAAVALVTDIATGRGRAISWLDFVLLTTASLLSLVNVFVHSRDAWTSVVPEGIWLSAVVAILLVIEAFRGWTVTTATVVREGEPQNGVSARASASLLAIAAMAACAQKGGDPSRQYGPNPVLPDPHQYLLPPMSVPKAMAWKTGETPTVPAGLRIQAIATGLMHPRIVYTLPNGDILVVESNGPANVRFRPKEYIQGRIRARAGADGKGGDSVTLLRDTNGDGVPELKTRFIEHLNSPFGIVLVGDMLYIANTDGIVAFHYMPGATRITAPPVTLTDLPAGEINHHWTKAMAAGPDGSKLYVGVGSNSNITENGMDVEEGRAAIYEVDRITGAKRIYAAGTRNPTGLAFEPTTRRLFAIVNERDEIGPDLVPDYLTSIKEGGFYGWPFSYWGQHVDVRVHPENPQAVARAIRPDYGLSSHVAPVGIAFSTGETLSPAFANGAFIGEHGSWDRSPLNGYQVIFVPFVGGMPHGKPIPVVTGFLGEGNRTVRGRPVGVALDRTGSLLVADDVANIVWRISAAPSNTARTSKGRS